MHVEKNFYNHVFLLKMVRSEAKASFLLLYSAYTQYKYVYNSFAPGAGLLWSSLSSPDGEGRKTHHSSGRDRERYVRAVSKTSATHS